MKLILFRDEESTPYVIEADDIVVGYKKSADEEYTVSSNLDPERLIGVLETMKFTMLLNQIKVGE